MANEDKSARYHRLRRRTELLDTAVQVAFLVILVVSGASIAIRSSVESSVGTSLVPVAIAYVWGEWLGYLVGPGDALERVE